LASEYFLTADKYFWVDKLLDEINLEYLNTFTTKSSLYEAGILEEIVKHPFLEMLKFI